MLDLYGAEQLVEVVSSLIKSVGTRGDYLLVEFKNKDVYRYPGLACMFESLVHAESVGKYFHQHIRANACQKLRGEWPDGEE